MMKITSPLLMALSVLAFQVGAQAASMQTEKIEMTFQSKDGRPVEGVSLAGMLQYEALKAEDCSGWICVPSLPKYQPTADGAVLLGETDSNGVLVADARTWKAKALTARKLKVAIFTNGLISDICKDGSTKVADDTIEVLPQFIDNQPVPRNAECDNVTVVNGDPNEVRIKCYSPYTSSEIESMRAAVLKKCSK